MSERRAAGALRIGEVARAVGTTPRTIRYYEEVGLLAPSDRRAAGAHRLYAESDVERLRVALRLKELLGVSLDELRELMEAHQARAALRAEWHTGDPPPERRREILEEALRQIDRQLVLVRRRRAEIARLESELVTRRRRLSARRRRLR